jgi:PKD repeat protein
MDANNTRGYAHVKVQVTPASACSVTCTASAPTSATPGTSTSLQATATATGCSGSPAYLWNFGDGQMSAQQNPSHAYAAAGTYTWTLTVTAGSTTCAKSGTITVAASTGGSKRRAIFPPTSTFNGTDVVISPSSSPQTVRYGGASVTIPGGMLTAAQHVKVSVAQGPPPANFALLKQMGAYNIEIGTMHSLPAEVTVRMKYDPAAVRSDIPAGRAISASYWSSDQSVWVTMPSEIDSTTNEIVVRTRHLSLFSWSMVKLGYDVFFKNHFYIVYNKAEVTDPNFLRWYRNPDASNYVDINTPNYIEDTMAFFIDAYGKYVDDTKFNAPSTPIDVYVGTDMSSFTDKFTGIILISLVPQNPAQLKLFTAHELFHRVQNTYYYDLGGMLWLKWWLEATADYAGDHVAWGGINQMGSKISYSYLEAPLTDSGDAHDEGYSTSYFVKYLVDQGANFKAMWDATANPDWFDSFSFVDGLSTYLQKTFGLDNGLNRQYRKFARYFIFDANSPMPAITDSMYSQVAAYRSTITGTGDSAAFNLTGGYTAKLWGIRFSDGLFSAGTPRLKYTVATVGALPSRVEVDVYVLKGDTRVAGGGVPAGTLAQGTNSVQVEVEKGDVVYVLAVNADGSDRQVSVSITNDAVTPPPPSSWSKVEVWFQLPVKDSGGSGCPWIYAPMLERKSLVTPKCTATGSVAGTVNVSCNDGAGVTMKAAIDGTLAQYFGPPNFDPPRYYFSVTGQPVAKYANSMTVTIDYGNRVCTWQMGTDFAGAGAVNSPAYLKVYLWP